MKQLIIVSIFILCCSVKGFSQALQPGDEIPSLVFKDVINTSSSTLTLDDLKGKLVIFDFWSTGCIGCIQAFPEIELLQQRYSEKVQIILVNEQSKDSTLRFFAKRKKIKIPSIPFVTGDTILHKLFPHDGVPFHVWVDGTGVVRYITNGYNSNESSISRFIKGEEIALRGYETGRTKIAPVINRKYEANLRYFSYLSSCIKGYQDIFSTAVRKRSAMISTKCASVVELYKMAFDKNKRKEYDRPGKFYVSLEDSFRYNRPVDKSRYDEWMDSFAYNYELLVPVEKAQEIHELMQADLQRYFGLDARLEQRQVKCLVLVRTSTTDKLKSKGGKPENTFIRSSSTVAETDPERRLINRPYTVFSERLCRWLEKKYNLPFVDLSGYSGSIDLTLSGDIVEALDIAQLNKELAGYDFQVRESYQSIEVLVLKF